MTQITKDEIKRVYKFEPSGYFECAACGKQTFTNDTRVRYYEGGWCAHPILKGLGTLRTCPPCYNWDTDAHKRKRKFNSERWLKVKDSLGTKIYIHPPAVKPEVQELRASL